MFLFLYNQCFALAPTDGTGSSSHNKRRLTLPSCIRSLLQEEGKIRRITVFFSRTILHATVDLFLQSGVTLLLINLSNSTAFDVVVTSDLNLYRPRSGNEQGQHGEREEYHLTAQGGDLRSSEMLLNGKLLKLTPSFEIPHMEPSIVSAGAPLTIAPLSIAFVRFKDFQAPACAGN